MKPCRLPSFLVLACVLLAGVAHAERADRSKPMNIESDTLRYDDAKQTSVFTGRVVVTKGSIVMRGAQLEVRQDNAGNQFGVLKAEPGKRAFFRQKRDTRPGATDEYMEGEADTIEYDGKADTVRFLQRAELRRYLGTTLNDEMTGVVIVYDNATSVLTVDGGPAIWGGQDHARRHRGPRAGGADAALRRGPSCGCSGTRRCAGAGCTGTAPFRDCGRAEVTGETPGTGPDGTASRLEALHLQKSYGSRTVVKDVSLAVGKGEVVGLLGPNGAGKTTSFYMIVGLVRASAGDITIDGRSVEDMPIHRRARLGLSYLPQEASIFRKLNVQDNVRAVLELQTDASGQPLAPAVIEERLDGLLKDLRVEHLRDSPALALSGGERRRVEIARALATQPRFILLDEPFAGIDPIAVIEIQRIINFLKSRGIGVLITDHNVRETLGICDHAYIISDGHVLAQGTPAEIVANADVRRVYLGEHFKM